MNDQDVKERVLNLEAELSRRAKSEKINQMLLEDELKRQNKEIDNLRALLKASEQEKKSLSDQVSSLLSDLSKLTLNTVEPVVNDAVDSTIQPVQRRRGRPPKTQPVASDVVPETAKKPDVVVEAVKKARAPRKVKQKVVVAPVEPVQEAPSPKKRSTRKKKEEKLDEPITTVIELIPKEPVEKNPAEKPVKLKKRVSFLK